MKSQFLSPLQEITLARSQRRDRVWLERFKSMPRLSDGKIFWRYEVGAMRKEVVVIPPFELVDCCRIVVTVGEGAEVTLLDEQALAESELMQTCTPLRSVIVSIAPRAKVRWQGVQRHDGTVTSFDHKRFCLNEGAELDYFNHIFGGLYSYDEAMIELAGARSSARSQTIFFGRKNQQEEMRVTHRHVGRDTFSRMVSKGAVKDQAHGSFLGMIRMEPGCDGADGYLAEHNLLLSDRAKIDAVPGLEIGHHNVKAGHAATMERVDEKKLFYLASRGIPKSEAIELILEGFFWDALQKMKNPEFERRIFEHILTLLHL